MSEARPPYPPFDLESAARKVQAAEDARRGAGINDIRFEASQRRHFGSRPAEHRACGRDR